jgi:hypothetical protein
MKVVFTDLDECPRCGATLCDEMCVPCAKRKIRAMEAAQQSVQRTGWDCANCDNRKIGDMFSECPQCGTARR